MTRHDWLGGVLAGITLAMGVLPEEFPVVLTVFLAMGAWRISRANVLTRRMPAVETIGAATVLAVDKTGTLTENRMRLALIQTADRTFDLRLAAVNLEADAGMLLGTALAASEKDAFDPMEHAIHEGAALHAPSRVRELADMTLVREYDLTPELLAVTHVWRRPGAAALEVECEGRAGNRHRLVRYTASQARATAGPGSRTRRQWHARAWRGAWNLAGRRTA